MVLVINRSFNSPSSKSVFRLFRFNLRKQNLKRHVNTESTVQELINAHKSSLNVVEKPSKPPFAKNLFLGIFDKDVLLYPEVFSIEHLNNFNKSLEPVEQYFKDKVNSKDIDINAKIPEEIIKELKAFGLFGLRIPREFGGQGVNATEYARLSEVIAADSSVSLLLAAHESLGVQSILLGGSEEQKRKYLPKLASGELSAAFCISEEISGSDISVIQTTGTKEDDESSYILNGSKLWVTNGTNANIFTVLAQTSAKNQFGEIKSVSAFLVEKDFPGVTLSKPTKLIGVKGAGVNEITLNNVVVPAANMLGEEGSGLKLAIDVLNSNRFAMGARTIALLKTLLGLVTEHVIHRKQFTSNLINFELIQKQCADVVLTIYALESMTYLTAALHDQFQDYDGFVENAIVKAYAMEEGQRCIDICLNLLGARGCMADQPYEKFSRDFRTASIFDGSLDVTKLYIASMGLYHSGINLNEDVKKLRNPLDYSGFIFKRIFTERRNHEDNPKLDLELYLQLHSSLLNSSNHLEYCVLRLKYAVTSIFARYGSEILDHQIDLLRLTKVVMDIYAMTAVLGRASRAYCTGINHAETEILLAQKLCYDGFWRVKANVNNMVAGAEQSGDVFYFRLADDLFKHHGYFLEHPTKRNI